MKITRKKSIGIFGGTFDPIHNGHVQIIENFLKLVHLDELIVVPTGNPPHKEKRIEAGDRFRLGYEDNLPVDGHCRLGDLG